MFSAILKKGWLGTLLLCAFCNLQAQVQEVWRSTFTNTTIRDYAADADGNLFLATTTDEPDGHGGFTPNLHLLKLAADGNSGWTLNLGRFSSSGLASKMLVLDAAGNACVATEQTNSLGYLLRKINPAAQIEWQVLVPLAAQTSPSLAVDAFGNLCMGGIVGSDYFHKTFWFGAYSPNGGNLWRTNFAIGTNLPTELAALTSSSDNHWIFSASDWSLSTTRRVLGSFALDGALLWAKPVEQALTTSELRKLFAGENGTIYLSGYKIAKLDSTGALLWLKTNVTDIVKVEPTGELFASQGGGNRTATLMRLNANGEVLWQQPVPQQPFSIVSSSGGRWLAGAVNNGYWSEPIRLVSFDQAGEQLWQMRMTNIYQPPDSGKMDLLSGPNGTVHLIAQIAYPFGTIRASSLITLREAAVSGLPHITSHPASATLSLGQTALLQVQAAGDGPLSYQWFRNGQPVPGEQKPVWSWTAGSVNDSGDYFVQVSNSAGSIYSKVATLRVLQPPFSYEPTRDISAALNGQVALSAGVQGSELRYQWYNNGAPLPGGTNAVLIVQNLTLSDSGQYSVWAANDVGTYLRTVAQLQVTASVTQEWALVETNLYFRDELGLSVNQDGTLYFLRGGLLTKFSSAGDVLWETNGYFSGITSDGSNGVIAQGWGPTMHYSADGTPIWASPISSLQEPPFPWNGSFVGFYDYVLVLDAEGNLASVLAPQLTNKTFSYVQKLKKSPDGGLVCSAVAIDTNDLPTRFLAKWNANAQQMWSAPFLEGQDYANLRGFDFAVAPDGRVLLSTLVVSNWTHKQLTTCFDSAGHTLWQASYDPGFSEGQVHVAVDSAGNTIVTGEAVFLKYDAGGHLLWRTSSEHPPAGVPSPDLVRLDSSGNIYLVGRAYDRTVVDKFSPEGNSLWVASLPGDGYGALEISSDGSIYVAGPSWEGAGLFKLRNLDNPLGPSILRPPSPALAVRHPGESVTFAGEVSGAPPLHVRWLRGSYDWNRPGQGNATNLTLNLANLDYADAGEYFLEVRNDYGVVCSSPATLKVSAPPDFLFSQHDENWYWPAEYLRVNEGSSLKVYTIKQNATADDTWQWYLNGVLIPGATSSTLVLPGVTRAMAGTITARVTNIFGSAEHTVPLYVDSSVKTVFETTIAAGQFDGGPGQSPRLTVNKAGEIYLLGVMNSEPSDPWSPRSWFLQKYRANGSRSWQVNRPVSSQNTTAPWLRLDAAGNLVVSASREENSGLVPWVTKVSPSGGILWDSKLPPAAAHTRDVTAMVLGGRGEIYIAGLDWDQERNTKVFVSRVAPTTGKAIWTSLFPAGELSWLASAPGLASYPNDAVCLSSARGLTRILSTGSAVWTVGTNFFECAVDASGATYGVGYHSAKYSLNGRPLWQSIQPGLSPHLTAQGLVTVSSRLEWTTPAIRKLSPNGTPLWSIPADGNEIVTGADGSTFVSGGYYGPVVTRKLDASGTERWSASPALAEGWNSGGAALALCTNRDLVVAHLLLNSTNGSMYILARYQDALKNQTAHLSVTPARADFQAGRPLTLNATVSGISKYRLQWYRDGLPLPGQTNLTLRLTGVKSDAARYQAFLFSINQVLASVEVPVLRPYPYFEMLSNYDGTRYLLPQTENWAYPAQIQFSTNLLHWTDFLTPIYPGMTIPVSTNLPAAYYRAIQSKP